MSRFNSCSSTDHRVQSLGNGCYRISWVVDRYYSGDRLRYPTVYSRDTDEAGARRFVKKWKPYRVPEELK